MSLARFTLPVIRLENERFHKPYFLKYSMRCYRFPQRMCEHKEQIDLTRFLTLSRTMYLALNKKKDNVAFC